MQPVKQLQCERQYRLYVCICMYACMYVYMYGLLVRRPTPREAEEQFSRQIVERFRTVSLNEYPKRAPRESKKAPRGLQDRPREPQESFKRAQEDTKRDPRQPKGVPRGPEESPGSPEEAPEVDLERTVPRFCLKPLKTHAFSPSLLKI